MRALVCALFWVLGAALVWAQDDRPKIEIQFEETETVPGQFVTLRVTVLVPTFMPQPPVWPDLESPNLMVRLPEKASSPTSKQIGGETWSGISRRYQVTPVVPGTFEIPGGEVLVRYRALTGSDLLEARLPVPAQQVSGVVPEGAETLDPFLAANAVTLSQSVEGKTQGLGAGDSFSRVLEAKIEGVSPMFLPPLTPQEPLSGLRAYPESPGLDESENRGIVSGVRREKTAYVVESSVSGALPEARLAWYNLKTGKVEEAVAEAISVQADAPAPPPAASELDWTRVVRWAGGVVIVAAALASYLKWVSPWVRRGAVALRQNRLNSTHHAYRVLKRAVAKQDFSATQQAYRIWDARLAAADVELDHAISEAFRRIGAARFGQEARTGERERWRNLAELFRRKQRQNRYRTKAKAPDLPGLNPVAAPE